MRRTAFIIGLVVALAIPAALAVAKTKPTRATVRPTHKTVGYRSGKKTANAHAAGTHVSARGGGRGKLGGPKTSGGTKQTRVQGASPARNSSRMRVGAGNSKVGGIHAGTRKKRRGTTTGSTGGNVAGIPIGLGTGL
ncbi:MAG TPA: hypothetical protein VGH10_06625 [Actinomycetota bacterium]|jgi:hypothetical protein